MRLLLGVASTALVLTLPAGGAVAAPTCVGNGPVGVCYEQGRCVDHHCIQREHHVTVYCNHPIPARVCALLGFSTR